MSTTAYVLLAFAGWSVLLALAYVTVRVAWYLVGRHRFVDFDMSRPLTEHDPSPFYRRLVRAHLNVVENLPVVASVLLVAIATGRTAATDPLAPWLFLARVTQSLVHVAAVTDAAIVVRGSLWYLQLGLLGWMVVRLVG